MEKTSSMHEYKDGLVKGLPVFFGYLPVSFTFGIMCMSGGMAGWLASFCSLSNLTSAGQFAGVKLIFAGAGLFEIAFTTFIINLRYMLMSLSLSQRLEHNIPLWQKLIFGYAVTDEIFAIASMEHKRIRASYMFGLMTTPVLGWFSGTVLGVVASGILSDRVIAAMGIALYGMFIALIIPPAKKERPVLITIAEAVTIMCVLEFVPVFGFISSGFKVIISTIAAAALSAWFFPIAEELDNAEAAEVSEADDDSDTAEAAEVSNAEAEDSEATADADTVANEENVENVEDGEEI